MPRRGTPIALSVRHVLLLTTVAVVVLAAGASVARAEVSMGNSDCWECHDPNYHVAAGSSEIHCDGAGCHDGFGYSMFTDIDWSASGHSTTAGDCTWCHTTVHPDVPQHDPVAVEAMHASTTTGFDACAGCHTPALIDEHGGTCGLCHQSTAPAVIAAIQSGNTTCSACHADSTSHDALHEGGTSDPQCLSCHEANISTEHAGNCGLCHESVATDVVAAIADGRVTCDACHDLSAAHTSVHDGVTSSATCNGCHGGGLLDVHSGGCDTCHASSVPRVVDAITSGVADCGTCHPSGHYRGASLAAYLAWTDAQALMTANGVDASLQNTPHGGYAANTTKCAVCHSVHRAASDATVAGIGTYTKLTPGAQACTACHTAWGANPIPTALVEWAPASSGPHSSFQCLGACHAGVHGGTTSEYGAVQAYNLTNRNDAAIAAAFAAGNVSGNTTATAGGSNKHATYAAIDDAAFRSYVTTTAQDIATMRAMATGYTCGASGCHSSSQFAVNKRGYAELRAGDPSNSTTLNTFMTAHITNMPSGCGPCHVTNDSKCAACHDMKGKATNSSAFPHANRNITVIETDASGVTTGTLVASGNLWMYAGDATMRDASGEPSATGTTSKARTVITDAAGFNGTLPGNINDGTCIKCHGYKYWPTHGLQATGSHGGSAALNFSVR